MTASTIPPTLALLGPIGTWEGLVILILGLLIFGRRLPEVGRSLGKGIVEFRRGLKGVEEEVEAEANKPARTAGAPPQLNAPENRVSRADPIEPPQPVVGEQGPWTGATT